MAVLERLAGALPPEGPPVRLCLIGSAAWLFGGMAGRASLDFDICLLISRHCPDERRVRQIVASFDRPAREKAAENLVYLDAL